MVAVYSREINTIVSKSFPNFVEFEYFYLENVKI